MLNSQKGSAGLIVGIVLTIMIGAGVVLGVIILSFDREPSSDSSETSTNQVNDGWSDLVMSNYMAGCVQAATSPEDGITAAAAQSYCECTASDLQQIYPTDVEFAIAEQEWLETGLPENVNAIVERCAAQALPEING